MSLEEQILRFFSCGNTLILAKGGDISTNIRFCFRQEKCDYSEIGYDSKEKDAICGLRKRLVSEDGKLGYVCEMETLEIKKVLRKLFLNRPASVHLVDWEVMKDEAWWP